MIAASEPLEFVPHGRTVLAKHPTQIYGNGTSSSASENSLLYKLANFDIKDESLLEGRNADEQEWWCIREVYYRTSEDFEDEPPQSPKETKCDYASESFRPPSRLKPDFNISIKSELMASAKKAEDVASAGTSRGGSANSSSNMSKKFNLSSGQSQQTTKPLNYRTDCSYEEELYVKGCTAVWSKGLISTPATKLSSPEHRETICCYTLENPIKHAAFVNFHVTINNTMLIDALNSQIGDVKKNIKIEDTTEHLQTKVMPSILLIDTKCMRVFATDGREYTASIPFQVKKIWPMKYGVLLEKDATPLLHNSFLPMSFVKLNESHNSTFSKSKTLNMSAKLRQESVSGYDQDIPLPTCFSLGHPLDEVTPILMKSPSHGLQYYNDGEVQIIFVSTNPSIILLYDWKLGTHSLWKIRKALRDECLSMCPNMNSTTTVFSQSYDFIGSPGHSTTGRNTTNWATGMGSPFHSRKGPGTPTMSRSRQNSPMANIFHQQGMSPHASIGQASSMSMIMNTMSQNPPALPLYPDICLDHIWTDSQTIRRDPIESPNDTKTFLHTDLVGHDYLCFMVKVGGVSRLQIVRLQKSHFHGQVSKTNLIVGSISTVLAKDAVVLEHLKMMALIDEAGNIILQSGNSVVGKVHVGGVLARLLEAGGGGGGAEGGAEGAGGGAGRRGALQSPFPRRSSLLPTRAGEAALDDPALHLLSPVPHAHHHHHHHHHHDRHRDALGLRGLCDAAGTRVTLVFAAAGGAGGAGRAGTPGTPGTPGTALYRLALPALACGALVSRCSAALAAALPKDITMQVIIKWYGIRNAPGTQDLTPEQEWAMFSNLLLSLIGYDVERLAQPRHSDDQLDLGEVATKKQRTSSDGTQDDWEYLLNSKLHKAIGNSLATMLNLNPISSSECRQTRACKSSGTVLMEKHSQFNTNALLFPYTIQVLYAFHLVYEEIKLNTLLASDLGPLSKFLYQLSKDLRLKSYVNHYWLDFPTELSFEYDESESQMTEEVLKKLTEPSYFTAEPPNVFAYLNSMLNDVDCGLYPHLNDVNNTSRDLIEIASMVGCGSGAGVVRVVAREGGGVAASSTPRRHHAHAPHAHCRAVLHAHRRGIRPRDVEQLPPALALLLQTIFMRCKGEPPADWPAGAYNLVMREDLALQADIADTVRSTSEYMESLALEVLEKETAYSLNNPVDEPIQSKGEDNDTTTGMEHLNTKLLSLLYPRDHRMAEVINLVQSSIPVTINLTQRPEVSDHDFIEEQEKQLYAINTRTMALPIARGMVTLRSVACAPTEPVAVPRLCVSGRGPAPRRNHIAPAPPHDTPPHALAWPAFHSGAAAGLALLPHAGPTIHCAWLLYNRPRNTTEMSTEHAGFLMALGLNGHLRDMPFMNMYEYLVKCNEMTSVGLLLGLAATYRGTMDVQATKMMSIHLAPLLPPTSIELDIQQNILVAALLGVGLVYQGTMHSHYARVLLDEIGKPPGPEMENCVEREGYALAAGLALGLVCLRAHAHAHLHLAPRLRTYMLGGDKLPLTGSQRDKYKQGSFAIREGGTVNLDVTSPGATVALGLIYLRSGDAAVASWLEPPRTAYLLDFVRPDLLMLRVIARGLVLWDSIEASEEWVEDQVPATIKPYCFVKPTEENIDYEAMNQAYCNIVAGACFAMGLRFAGSGDEDARDAIMHFVKLFLALGSKSIAELAGRSTLETCLCVCLLAAGMVMAGRGDVCVMRVCRRLRARVLPPPPAPAPAPPGPASASAHAHALTHGAQMAVHMALGLLFVGAGRGTLSTSPAAVAALLAACFPKFPTHTEDNRYHLQAFRHLYVLAVEPRLILPRDIDTGKLCYAHIQVVDLQGASRWLRAPCLLPELETLREVRVTDPRYWPITFLRDTNWDHLKTFLEYTWCVDIKQRAGCLSYLDDPHGFLTILAQTLTTDRTNIWSVTPDNIELFTNDDKLQNFIKHYLTKECSSTSICADCLLICKKKRGKMEGLSKCQCRQYSREELEHIQALSMVTYECVVRDILCALPIWTTFMKIVKAVKSSPSSYHMWQIRLLSSLAEREARRALSEMRVDGAEPLAEPLVSAELALAIRQRAAAALDAWEPPLAPHLRRYLAGDGASPGTGRRPEDHVQRMLSAYVVYHDVPRGALREVPQGEEEELSAALGLGLGDVDRLSGGALAAVAAARAGPPLS